MSVMFFDVENTYRLTFGSLPRIWSDHTPFWELAYADDTVLLSRTMESLQNHKISGRFMGFLEV